MSDQDQLMSQLHRTLRGEAGLPGTLFTNAEIFEREMQQVYAASWVGACMAHEVDGPGGVRPLTVAGLPIVVLRDREGVLRAFHNVCSHRGAVLVTEPGVVRKLTCAYHCWTYDLAGRLLATPHVGGQDVHQADEIDPSSLSLAPVPVAEWCGVIFVNPSGTAQAFADHIAPVQKRLAAYDLTQLRCDPALGVRAEVKANWKIVVENFVESYHVPWVHPGLQSFNPMGGHFQILGGGSYVGQGGASYSPTDDAAGRLPAFNGADPAAYEALYVYPNTILLVFNDAAWAMLIEPSAADATSERIEGLFVGEAALAPDLEPDRRNLFRRLTEVNAEDIGIVEQVQAGRRSPAFTGGQFSTSQEETSRHFQKMVAAALLGCHPDLPYGEIWHAA